MICIGFGANNSFRSKLIQWATDGDWSHVWIEYPSTCWGGQWVAHSADEGVVKEPCERVRARYSRVCIFEAKDFDLVPGMVASKELLGRKYDLKVIWNALLLVTYRATKWQWLWKLTLRDISKFTCSEFVATVLKRANLKEAQSIDAEFATPGGLFNICKESKFFLAL